jgi:uncharacterized OB-fold protein
MKKPLFRLDNGSPRLLGTECKSCRHRWFPALSFGCERCGAHGEELIDREFNGTGRLLSRVEVAEETGSYTLAMIQLDDGPVLGGIIEDPDTPSAGDRLEAFGTTIDDKPGIRFRRCSG